jgi:DNA-binding FadR family transcriptional regulator/uncharacterized protein YgbK (DUF1537 family)
MSETVIGLTSWEHRLAADQRRLVILDDDPTGTQTVSDVEVILRPSLSEYQRFFASSNRSIYVLTNSRALTVEAAVALVSHIRDEVKEAASQVDQSVAFLLRGDSTLRGHVFAEIDVLASPDSVTLFVPAFPEGGRVTCDGIQYIVVGDQRMPVAHTEFARDPVFGYQSKRLIEWVSEVGGGRDAVSLPLAELRAGGPPVVTEMLLRAPPGTVVIPDAENRTDLEIIAWGLLDAEDQGRHVVVRAASSFAAVRAGLYSTIIESVGIEQVDRVLVICGSYTTASTQQIERLVRELALTPVVVPTKQLLRDGVEHVVPHLIKAVSHELENRRVAVLMTERVKRARYVDLAIGAKIMEAIAATVRAVADHCDAVISKGGITSAIVATEGLLALRAHVQGQLEAGVPLWDLHLAGDRRLPYAVVPGNVGTEETLVNVLRKFGIVTERSQREPTFQLEPIEQKPFVTEVTQRLLDYLLSGALKPGDRLPSERQLSEALGLGRSTVREALKALTVLGLLDVRPGGGTYLKKADSPLLPRIVEWSLLLGEKRTMDLVEARQRLEVVIAELAAQRRDQQSVVELRQILEQMRASTADYQKFTEADVALHLKLAQITGNMILQDILGSIRALLRAWIVRTIEPTGSAGVFLRERIYREHVPIVEAVERGDPQAAAAAMRAHMEAATRRLLRTIAADASFTAGHEEYKVQTGQPKSRRRA